MDAQVRLDEDTSRAVDGLVEAGRFDSAEAVVRESVRLLREHTDREERVRALVQPALDSLARGEGTPAEEVFDRLIARYEKMAEEREK